MSILYIVATPIGNLKDMSSRAIEVLGSVDEILCEDTRVTKKLLNHYNIKTRTSSFHQHSQPHKVEAILGLLKKGKNLALVSDAGTPGVSDPGGELVERVAKEFGDKISIIPIPGASAVTTSASVSGFPTDKFLFLGYPPSKKKRRKYFEEVAHSPHTVIFYESPHRILKTLTELQEVMEGKRQIVLCKELTKMFETIFRGTITHVLEELLKVKIKGEFVVVVSAKKKAQE